MRCISHYIGFHSPFTTILARRNISGSSGGALPQVQIDNKAKEAQVIMPGYSYGDLDRVGRVKIWKVALLSEAARVTLYDKKRDPTPPALTNALKEFQNLGVYLGAARYEVTREFYDRSHYYNPVRFQYSLSNFGRSSYAQALKAYSEKTGQLLHKDSIFNVVVNLEEKRPMQMPEEFLEYFTNLVVKSKDETLEPVKPVSKPEVTLCHKFSVDTTHMDYYYHTNQANYLKFVHDAISRLTFEGKIKLHKSDFAKEKIKVIEGIYKGETKPGDNLDIHVWQSDELEICLQIERDDVPVFQSRVELYAQ